MRNTLDFFFFIGSTYTYLTVNRIEALAEREGVAFRWRPFNVRALMIEQNNRPFVGKPVKLKYMWRDVERRAGNYGVPFRAIPPYPVDMDDLANRVGIVAAGQGWCPEYTRAVYRSWFLDGIDPGDLDGLTRVLSGLGRDPDSVLAEANAQGARERYIAETDSARKLGIFGSPTFVYGEEIFWGDDRLEDAVRWAKTSAEAFSE